LNHIGKEPRAVLNRWVIGALYTIDRKKSDSGPTKPYENAVRTCHVSNGEVGRFTRTSASLPCVEGINGILRRDSENSEHCNSERLWDVFFSSFSSPGEQECCS
jgi:hypothetical protein